MKEQFGSVLRKYRESSGLSVDDVCSKLSSLGYKISPKTLYGYENDVSAPKISLFMTLCRIYEVPDLYNAFNVCPAPLSSSIDLTEHELIMLLAYRSHPETQPFVDRLLGIEVDNR